MRQQSSPYLRPHIALPQQHGAWVMWAGPLIFGLAVARDLTPATGWLLLASLSAFMTLQPLTLVVKILAGRRPRNELGPGLLWLGLYAAAALIGVIGLALNGAGWTLMLGVLAAPVLIWQMSLVMRREERGQMGVEVVGSGVLALNALAGYGVASEAGIDTRGLVLFALSWLQSAAGIVYIFLCLDYRRMKTAPPLVERPRLARRALLYSSFNVVAALALAALGLTPWGVVIAFVLMLAETALGGLAQPPIGARPAAIGVRQLIATTVFFAVMIAAYLI